MSVTICDWISVKEAVFSKSAFMSALIARLRLETGIDLSRNQIKDQPRITNP